MNKFNKRAIIKAWNNALNNKIDANIASAMYTDVENRIHLGGEKFDLKPFWRYGRFHLKSTNWNAKRNKSSITWLIRRLK